MADRRSRALRQEVAERAADAALGVAGVAWLRPALAGALRSVAGVAGPGTGRGLPAVQVHPGTGGAGWSATVDLRLTLHRGRRAVEITRAVHEAVTAAALGALPPRARVAVTVTVTGII